MLASDICVCDVATVQASTCCPDDMYGLNCTAPCAVSGSVLVAVGANDQVATLLCDHPFESAITLAVDSQGHSHIIPARILEAASVGIA